LQGCSFFFFNSPTKELITTYHKAQVAKIQGYSKWLSGF